MNNYSKEERDLIYRQARELILSMQESGIAVPEAMKRRDRKEPSAEDKERLEDRIAAVCKRHWKRQKEAVLQRVQMFTGRKSLPPPDNLFQNWSDDDEFEAAILRLILYGMNQGIDMFGQSVNIGLDYTLVNKRVLEKAKKYAYDLIRGIDETSLSVVRSAVEQFISVPGFTMGDLANLLEPSFGEVRARKIAVTEVTRAYAQGQKEAGGELKKQFPGVKVTKEWFTNEDDRVCEMCGPLNGMEVELDALFAGEISDPPAHITCRCWENIRTRINE